MLSPLFVLYGCTQEKRLDITGEVCKAPIYCNDTLIEGLVFTPIFIGEPLNSINLADSSGTLKYLADIRGQKNTIKINNKNSRNILDTNVKINYRVFNPYAEWEKFSNCYCEGFAYRIINTSNDTLQLSEGEYVPLVIQGFDSRNKIWNNLNRRYIYLDNNGINALLLPPGNMVLFSIPKILDKNYSKFRIMLDSIRSPEYF